MNIAFHTGKSAMIAQSQALNVYGNNIANINTYGYQTVRPSFADCLYSKQRAPEEDWQTGHGTYIQKTDVMFDESSFYYTERPLDFALPNEGFFAVENRYGDINYTRDGAFSMTQAETGEWYLVSGSGEYVLDYDMNRIVVPFNEEGTVADYDALKDMVGVFEFENVYGIEAAAANRYTATERSGEVTANRDWDKLQGVLITSNVNLADQMVKLIETQRAYQISSRVVTTSDEFTRLANNLR
ncbi:MAG: flagellar hook-basal body protein [Oscillospiraceae bacterium]|nr:flagellar hook-basal body protein [Oscillospiraceae bacterium]